MSNNPNLSTNLPGHAIWLNLANQAAQGDSESEVYSDSEDGGMQLDPPEPMVGQYSIDHDALFESPRSPNETRDGKRQSRILLKEKKKRLCLLGLNTNPPRLPSDL